MASNSTVHQKYQINKDIKSSSNPYMISANKKKKTQSDSKWMNLMKETTIKPTKFLNSY